MAEPNPQMPDCAPGAEQEPNMDRTGDGLPADLAMVVDSWGRLPDPVKKGILAMIEATGQP